VDPWIAGCPWVRSRRRPGATLLLLAGIVLAQAATFWSLPAAGPVEPAAVSAPAEGGSSRRRAPALLLIALTVPEIAMAAGYGAIKPFLSLFLTEGQGLSTSATGTVLALANAGAGVAVLLVPTLTGRVGHVRAITGCRLLGIGAIGLWFAGLAPLGVVLLVCLALALIDGTEAPYVAEAMDHVPEASRTTFSGLYSLLWSAGSIAASLASGRLQDATGGFAAAFALGIAGYAASALWIGAVFPRLPRLRADHAVTASPIDSTTPVAAGEPR
jgi:hypothetical protein